MVEPKKKETNKIDSSNKDESEDTTNSLINAELDNLNKSMPVDKVDNPLNKVDSDKDKLVKKKSKTITEVYNYWVYLFKDGKKYKDFGVKEETYNGIKLLVRRESINGEQKVIFRELYPEPRFDLNTIYNNRHSIKKELNKLKQIEKKLEKNFFNNKEVKEYNYDLSDVRISILQREIELESIKYGRSYKYFFDIRSDAIPSLFYEMENSGFRLQKYVKEKNLICEASEGKKIESQDAKNQIDKQLKKDGTKDWQRIALTIIWVFLTAIYMYGAFQWLFYNQDRAFADTKQKLEEIILKQVNYNERVITSIESNYDNDETFQTNIIKQNSDILNSCIAPTSKPIAS